MGLVFGLNSVAHNLVVSQSAPIKLRRRFLSGLHGFYGLAALTTTVVVFLSERVLDWDWREVFSFSAFLLFGLFFVGLLLKDPHHVAKSIKPKRIPFLELFHGAHIYVGLILSFYIFGEVTIASRIVLFLMRDYSMGLEEANYFLMLFFFCLFLSRFFLFIVKIHFQSLAVLLVSCFSAALCCAVGLLWSEPLWLSLSALFMGPFYGFFIEYLHETFPKRAPILISSSVSFSIMGAIGLHFLLGYITEFFDIYWALWLSPVGLCSAAFLLIFKKRMNFV